ncbi:MAG: hypothetical protein JRD04_05390 [Deltaproteobacteria bacterium]|nr:hypothetical protein [Deltaproteobacteria bacterium]
MEGGFNGWLQAFKVEGNLAFHTRISLKQATTITVQLIGKWVSCQPGRGQRIQPRAIAGPAFRDLSASTKLPGSVLTFELPDGEHDIRIVVTPVSFRRDRVPGLNIIWDPKKNWPQCLCWQDCEGNPWRKPSRFAVKTSDEVVLLTKQGQVSRQAWDLGLTSLVGMDIEDRNSLAWILSGAQQDGALTLTLDARLQALAQEKLEQQILDLWGAADPYAAKRRGAVVLLDADTGAILAATTYPRLRSGVHPWDLRAFARYYPGESLRTFRPWQGVDAHNAPGSTFKPVVAMAAINAVGSGAPQADRIKKFLKGYSRKAIHKSGLTLDCAAYNPFQGICYASRNIPGSRKVVQNFKRHSLGSGFKPGDETLGLKQAIRESINVWFVRLGWLMDGGPARAYDTAMRNLRQGQIPPDRPDFFLGAMARTLGFNGPGLDLLANLDEDIPLYRTRPGLRSEGDTLFGAIGQLNLINPEERGLQQILTQNAFGQGMTATPLQMARVAAAVATDKLPHPYLVGAYNGRILEPPPGKELGFDPGKLEGLIPFRFDGMALLRAGMKAVPETGTARTAFKKHPDRTRVYGKTGTADVTETDRSFNTTWFIGWREPVQEGERRIAFACMVSHATGKGSNTGGSVAAPVVAKILDGYRF